jgi:hypothetical protein
LKRSFLCIAVFLCGELLAVLPGGAALYAQDAAQGRAQNTNAAETGESIPPPSEDSGVTNPQNGNESGPPEVEDDNKKAMALIPFWGNDQNLIRQFNDAVHQTLAKNEIYRGEPVDMNNLPPDVPEGGFPPYVCPSPSLTKDAPYALTGEVTQGDDGNHVRFYLWEMLDNRLLFSDELVAADRDQFEIALPSMLDWLFSWIKTPEQTALPLAETSPAEPGHWLYLALRGGISAGFYTRASEAAFNAVEESVNNYLNVSAAFQVSAQLLSFLGVQTEAIFTSDYAPFRIINENQTAIDLYRDPFRSYSLMIPLLVKLTHRQSRYFATVFGGAYLSLPLGEMQSRGGGFNFSVDPPFGYTAGVSTGIKAGPGFVFLDLRWSADLGQTIKTNGDPLYKRSMFAISIGYELGLINKAPK